jgi:UDP-2,3-diacylglucosamine pyrophosphatase LpxH
MSSNLLIISDLHLGEDIKDREGAGGTSFLRHVVLLERELEKFLAHYTGHRLDGRPWRLIVNGDMVDFLGICLLPRGPSNSELGDEDVTPEDHLYGVGSRPRAARAKMMRVLERHADVFRQLARFVAAGNEVAIVTGNHDVEFHWPVVQECFRRGVGGLWAELPEASA